MTTAGPAREVLPSPVRWRERILVIVLLLVHALLLAWGAWRHSPAIDEWGHLPSGILHWRTGRFDAYRVNPPLARMVAALPLLWTDLKPHEYAPPAEGDFRPEFVVGVQLYTQYGPRAYRYFTIGRWACLPFSLIGACVCWRWCRELYGRRPGVAALVLWCFSPNVLAHGQMLTPDVAATAIGLAASYLFWRWLGRLTWHDALLAGVGLGLALLTKTTWLLLFALWPAMWLALRRRGATAAAFCRELLQVLFLFAVGLEVLNAGYGCQGSFRRLGDYSFTSPTLRGPDVDAREGNRFRGTWLGGLPVPLPRDFVLGIDRQKLDFDRTMPSYLRGEWRGHGWWYYYLYGMAVKMPLGTLALVVLAAVSGRGRGHRQAIRAEIALLAPAVAVLTLVSSQTGFNHHLRYVLPAFPYLFIFAGKAFSGVWRRPPLRFLPPGLLAWTVASSLFIYPHSLAYFNESVGGPRNGHRHLLNSNLEWGQNLIYLREWLAAHPEVNPRGVALYCFMSPELVGSGAPPPPREPEPGWYVVSVDRVQLPDGFRYFLGLQPREIVGYTLHVYHLTEADCRRLRQEENDRG